MEPAANLGAESAPGRTLATCCSVRCCRSISLNINMTPPALCLCRLARRRLTLAAPDAGRVKCVFAFGAAASIWPPPPPLGRELMMASAVSLNLTTATGRRACYKPRNRAHHF